MARTAQQLRREIATLRDLQFTVKNHETQKTAQARIEYLLGELRAQVAREAMGGEGGHCRTCRARLWFPIVSAVDPGLCTNCYYSE